MFVQDEIDAVIDGARQAVDELAEHMDGLAGAADRSLSKGAACKLSEAVGGFSGGAASDCAVSTLPPGLSRILGIQVPVIVRLAEKTLPLSEVTRIAPGTIIEFEKPVDGEIDLLANNHAIGTGVAVKVNEHYGIQIGRIGSVRQRIDSLVGR